MTKYIKVEKCELHTCPYYAFKMSKSLGIDVICTLTGQQIEDITKEFPPICPLKEVVEC